MRNIGRYYHYVITEKIRCKRLAWPGTPSSSAPNRTNTAWTAGWLAGWCVAFYQWWLNKGIKNGWRERGGGRHLIKCCGICIVTVSVRNVTRIWIRLEICLRRVSCSPHRLLIRFSVILFMSKQFYVDEEGFSGHWEWNVIIVFCFRLISSLKRVI